ncbi:hypothetical protein [Streptomyces sp. NPDC048496]|uniref:hypothetical protein n=1 Tax=Streptomyces sp. NPDC048496 TaxID=3365558 RepID=UPI00371DCCA7
MIGHPVAGGDGFIHDFWTVAYQDERAVDAAYNALAEWYGGDRAGQNGEKPSAALPGRPAGRPPAGRR